MEDSGTIIENQKIDVGYEDTFIEGSLNKLFQNALISDKVNNIERKEPIKITQYDNMVIELKLL